MNPKADEKIAQWAIGLWKGGEEAEQALNELSKLKSLTVQRKDPEVFVRGQVQTGFVVGETDPVSIAVCLMFAIAGPYWPHVFPTTLDIVNREWKAALKQKPGQPPKKQRVKKPKESSLGPLFS